MCTGWRLRVSTVWIGDSYTRVVEGGVCIFREIIVDSQLVSIAEYTCVVRRGVCISCVRGVCMK